MSPSGFARVMYWKLDRTFLIRDRKLADKHAAQLKKKGHHTMVRRILQDEYLAHKYPQFGNDRHPVWAVYIGYY